MKITRDMFDYDDEAVIVTVNERRYRVTTEFDYDSSPDDADCYSDDDKEAWRNDVWHYVGVIVTPLDVPASARNQLDDSLWGVEYDFPLDPPQWIDGILYRYTDRDYTVMVHPVPEMIEEVIRNEQAYLTELAIQSYIYS